MSAPMDNNNTNINNSNDSNNGGNIVPEGSTTLGHSASAAESTSSAPPSHPGSSLDRMMALIQSKQDAAGPQPVVLDIDRVDAALRDGGISQSNQVLAKLTGIVQEPGQILVSTYVVNPQSIAAGNAYHLTVPPRYLELGEMRQAMNLNGRYGESALAARDAYMQRFYPEIDDNDWDDQSREIATQTNFADYSMERRLTLVRQQEDAEDNATSCPLFTWVWSEAHGGPTPYQLAPAAGARQFFRGPYDPNCIWNLADNAMLTRGEAGLLSILDIANTLRCMNGSDQNRFVFQMSRVLSIARLMERRCQGLFIGLIAAQRRGRDEAAKKDKARKERREIRLELTAAQAAIAKADSSLASVRRQHSEEQHELQQEGRDEKIALQNLLQDERLTTRDLRQSLKKAEATIAYGNTRLSAIESGSKDKDAARNDLQSKLAAAVAAETTAATKWERERQQLRDEIDRARQERDDALATLRQAKTEEEEYQRWRSRLARESTDRDSSRPSENIGSPSNRPLSRSLLEDTKPVRGQSGRHPAASEQRLTHQYHLGPEQAPTVGPETSKRTKQAQRSLRLHRACSLGHQ